MDDLIKTIRNHATTLDNNLTAVLELRNSKKRLVYVAAVACLIAFSVSLYLGNWLHHH